jgi:hypothetical protein
LELITWTSEFFRIVSSPEEGNEGIKRDRDQGKEGRTEITGGRKGEGRDWRNEWTK